MNKDQQTCKRTVQFLKELHDMALDRTRSLRFDKTHILHVMLISLYGSLVELSGCILTLLENRGKLGIPPLFRAFLETYVEFHNLVRTPSYGYHLDANDLKQSIKRLKAAKGGNPYLSSLAAMPDLQNHIDTMERELKELTAKGFPPLTIFDSFQRANMAEEYESLYSLLSSHSHSNKEALIERHIEIGDKDIDVVLYMNPDDEFLLWCLDPTAALLVSATIDIHEHFKSKVVDEVRLLKTKLDEVRSSELKPATTGLR